MLQSINSRPLFESTLSHPFSSVEEKDQANSLKDLLLQLAKDSPNRQFSTILRNAAESVRNSAFGYNRKVTKNKIIKLLQEFECCELADFVDETKIPSKEILPALEELEKENKIRIELRRRWQEPGKHYNNLYYLNN